MGRIRKMLGFKREAGILVVSYATFADAASVQIVPGVQL
jgi:hypothetical protein